MVIGNQVSCIDTLSVQLGEGELGILQDFTYVSSSITRNGEVKAEVKLGISKAARAFRYLQKSIFQNPHLSVATKHKVYREAFLSILLYGAGTWTIKAGQMKLLTCLHNRCVRTFMGVTRYQRW